MRIIESDRIPTPAGHYSPAIEHNGLLYVSGQLPVHPETKAVPATIEAQAELALQNLELILTESGSSREQVLHVRIYVSDIELWDAVNQSYAAFFGAHRPARAIVPTRDLHFGCLLEIEATAVVS